MQLGFMLIALIWKFDFSPFMILVIAILNDGGFEKLRQTRNHLNTPLAS